MNERIKELAIEAGYNMDMQQHQKFAELIVKECAKKAVLFADSTTIQGLPSKHIENYMLKHFGVEE